MRKITIEVPDNIADDLVEKYSKKKAWKPGEYDRYWCLNWWGMADSTTWNSDSDEGAYAIGNVYRTEEELEQAVEKTKALATIRRHAEQFEFTPDWSDISQSKYCVHYDRVHKKLDTHCGWSEQNYLPAYYPTEEAAEQAISEVGDAYLTLFGVMS